MNDNCHFSMKHSLFLLLKESFIHFADILFDSLWIVFRLQEYCEKLMFTEPLDFDSLWIVFRLQEYCEKLMFTEPLDFGRKAEELLWRKVFYDVIQLLKHHKKVSRKVNQNRFVCVVLQTWEWSMPHIMLRLHLQRNRC